MHDLRVIEAVAETVDAAAKPPPAARSFEDGPYSARFMLGHHKREIFHAAKRAKQPQGQWLGETALLRIDAERSGRMPFTVAPEAAADPSAAAQHQTQWSDVPPLAVDEIIRAVREIERLHRAYGTKLSPRAKHVVLAKRLLAYRMAVDVIRIEADVRSPAKPASSLSKADKAAPRDDG